MGWQTTNPDVSHQVGLAKREEGKEKSQSYRTVEIVKDLWTYSEIPKYYN